MSQPYVYVLNSGCHSGWPKVVGTSCRLGATHITENCEAKCWPLEINKHGADGILYISKMLGQNKKAKT
jgi:hypothetical protein